MTSKSPARPDKSGKNIISSGKSNVFAELEMLATKHEILKENYENLVKDFQSIEESGKHVNELNEFMKSHLLNQIKKLEANSLNMDLEKARREKEEYKKEIERMEREKKAIINDLRVKNQEILIAKKNQEDELKKMEDKYNELTKRFGEAEIECSNLKSLYEVKNLIGLRGNNGASKNEVIVVDDRNVNNDTTTYPIVISDESDAEDINPLRTRNIKLLYHRSCTQEEKEKWLSKPRRVI